MNEADVKDWRELETKILELRAEYAAADRLLMFRGLGDSKWPLTTTLERYTNGDEIAFADYYREIGTAQPQLETFTGERFEAESYPEILHLAQEYEKFEREFLWGGQLKAYGYMVYVRHLGFPSPLLDWTRSPYIAAFFAFRSALPPPSGRVSIFAYSEKAPNALKGWGSGSPTIYRFGSYVRTHRRHFIQQAEYTMCLQWELKRPWRFVSHEKVFALNHIGQDLLWKFNIPWAERVGVLKLLDDHNINAFSLFEDHGALLETLAIRRFVFDRRASS